MPGMSAVLPALRSLLGRWFRPAPDSLAAHSVRMGKSPWTDAVHLLWTAWIFLTPIFDRGRWNWSWAAFTAASYPLFLFLYAKCCVAPRRASRLYAAAMVLLCLALLPWYPSGLSYFVFGCVMLRVCNMPPRNYLLAILAADAVLILEAWLLHYPWQVILTMPMITFIVGLIINAERLKDETAAKLRLSHDEVRRLAATAERERIGRDLHDLLGHTLSLITLKLELARKLAQRDPAASRREMEEAERVAREALAEVRGAVTGYRAADLAGELASARLMLESSQVHLDYEPAPPMPAETERALALVLREAATNIARHARATRARIAFARDGDAVQLRIDDDGRGGVGGDGNGLSGMRARVAELGGTFSIDSPKGKGTCVLVRVPCKQVREAPEAVPP
jgi:two-component system sensor histidine kinase DesK